MVILLPDLGEEQTKKEIEDIKKNIKQSNGEISNEDLWGVRDLTYKIRKQEKGFYFILNFAINPEEIKELEKALILNPKVIRHLLLKTPKNYEIKTLSFYEEEAEKEAEEKKIEAKEKRLKKPEKVEKKEPKKEEKAEEKPKKKKTIKVKEEKIEEKAKKKRTEEVKEVEKEEIPEEKPATKELEKKSLEDIDAKLKSIIDDPDITL